MKEAQSKETVNWRSCDQPPEPNDFGLYITWNPNVARPGAAVSFYAHRSGIWLTVGGIMLFPSYWVEFSEVFDLQGVPAP